MFRKIIGLIVVGALSYLVYLLTLEKGFELGQYVTGIAVALTVIIISVAYWAFKPELVKLGILISEWDIGKDDKDKKTNHTKHILTVLEFPAYAYFPEYDQSDESMSGWAESDMYKYCMSHLESYSELLDSYAKAKKISTDIINKIKIKIQEASNLVEKTLSSFKELPESDAYLSHREPYFMKKRFKTTLFKNIASALLNKIDVRHFNIIDLNDTRFFILTDGSDECGVGDKNALTKLLELIKPLESDSKLRSLIKEIEELKTELRDRKTWLEFNRKREALVLDLTKGQRDLKGHCDYCP